MFPVKAAGAISRRAAGTTGKTKPSLCLDSVWIYSAFSASLASYDRFGTSGREPVFLLEFGILVHHSWSTGVSDGGWNLESKKFLLPVQNYPSPHQCRQDYKDAQGLCSLRNGVVETKPVKL